MTMPTLKLRLLGATAVLCALPALTGADIPATPYAPLNFLVGHCWRGAIAGSPAVDEHCFSWVYGEKFIRDRHVLHRGAGKPDAYGETLYVWDSAARTLEYLYIESEGGSLRGTVASEEDALVFPEAHFIENGADQLIRSRWTRRGADAYEVRTEFQVNGRWAPGFAAHMQRSGDAPAD
ncbi:MAG: hypothetical protein JOZ67_07760 [Gammaproteobacteria bacterium]|nr:hypothetical protein [Gammaproteobacteria bacterium]